MPQKEKKLIRLSIITLFLSLLMVYILLYEIKGNKIKQAIDIAQQSAGTPQITISINSGDKTSIIVPEPIKLEQQTNRIKTGVQTQNFASQLANIHMLSGTKLYYGKIDSIEKLGIKYQYALIDNTGTFLINLGTQNYDFETIARALNGNLYKVTTEQELSKNKLFGSKVIYINIPSYKDKTVLMLVYINKEVRLIQIEYKLYHQSKSYLKSLFIQ